MDQNSPEDVRRYCEVVGTFGPISEGLQKGMSVREITQSAFMSEIERINDLLTALLCTPEDKDEHLMYQLQNPKAMKASLKAILELLCDEQYIRGGCLAGDRLCYELARHNILRPMEGRCHWSYYEFGSFVNEVALRALMGKPFVKHNMDITGDLKVEAKGSGCQATIDFLTASQLDLFSTYKQRFQQQLEEWDRRHAGTKIPTA
ncbi:MAG: hypothetical protein J0651_01245, partial [Actinobacteria bacterium]|nr:hypothetical protein [Actinomycetota bacterium]